MTAKKVRCAATVTLQIKVGCLGMWEDSCPISLIHKQAIERAVSRIRRGLDLQRIEIVGEPLVDVTTSSISEV